MPYSHEHLELQKTLKRFIDEEINPQSVDWASDRSPNFTVRQDSGGFNALGNVRLSHLYDVALRAQVGIVEAEEQSERAADRGTMPEIPLSALIRAN